MNLLLIGRDNQRLEDWKYMFVKIVPQIRCHYFNSINDGIIFAKKYPIDVAFLDLDEYAADCFKAGETLQKLYPKINLIFCSIYTDHAYQAIKMHCSDYILKPVTTENLTSALLNLRYPVNDERSSVYLKCFGHFYALHNNQPIYFRYQRTTKLLAYLVDRRGELCSMKDIGMAIFGEEEHPAYLDKLRWDLISTLRRLKAEDVIIKAKGFLGINRSVVECDYYQYLDGQDDSFEGEYMSQYDFAKDTRDKLRSERKSRVNSCKLP